MKNVGSKKLLPGNSVKKVISWKTCQFSLNNSSVYKTKHNSTWSKTLSMPFDHLALCLVINLTMGGTGLLHGHKYLLLCMLLLLLPFTSHSKYLLPAKNVNF